MSPRRRSTTSPWSRGPALAQAGVVDAGGVGFLLLLDSMLHVLDGRPVPDAEPVANGAGVDALVTGATNGHGAHDREEHGDHSDLRYEVMYFLEADDDTIPAFKDVWAGI